MIVTQLVPVRENPVIEQATFHLGQKESIRLRVELRLHPWFTKSGVMS